ncbi:MAG: hypothetical protein EXS37_08715 [Opitutus sp.]|nr:hypothetical protein [Opitutus sp.]
MAAPNWGEFERLPGSQERNFEALCRSLVRLQYGRFGDFRGLANQPGVEFHLNLHSKCALGDAGEWLGWQCRWYGLASGKAIGTTRRNKIIDSIRKTEKALPELTQWILWTRHPLTAGDQKWFYAITTKMRLLLWTATDAEALLSGDAALLRGTYFDELILTPASLADLHQTSVATVQHRWLPAAHQEVDAERTLRRMLGEANSWMEMVQVADRLTAAAKKILWDRHSDSSTTAITDFVRTARLIAEALKQAQRLLTAGDFDLLRQRLETRPSAPDKLIAAVPRRLRATRTITSFDATNALADMRLAHRLLTDMNGFLGARSAAILADAGGGKTQLSAQLTAALRDRPAGILLHGRDLHSRQNLDDLARRVVFQGKPFSSMQALVAAADAAGQRSRRRLPVVIDGLNEAEDPRDWKAPLAALDTLLQKYPGVLLVVTLRTGARRPGEQLEWGHDRRERESPTRTVFAEIALPEGFRTITMEGFGDDAPAARRRYFQHYRIIPDADLPVWLLDHPLTLRIFCEVTNPTRTREVGSEAMPRSLTALFERYLQNATIRIAELAPKNSAYCAQDVRKVLDEIGTRLWAAGDRELSETPLREAIGDEKRLWNESIIRLLEQEGIILRIEGDTPGEYCIMPVYDALGGYLIANSLLSRLGREGFKEWLKKPENLSAFEGSHEQLHLLATDIFRSLVGLVPRRLEREQLWFLLEGNLRNTALVGAIRLERDYLDHATVAAIGDLFRDLNAPREVLVRLTHVRGAPNHPLNADFIDAELRKMPNADRDLRWTEWIREVHEELRYPAKLNFHDLGRQWQDEIATRTVSDRLRAKWMKWLLTTTSRELRDLATRALYWFGRGDPESLFSLTIDALAIGDPYVAERMLAASYGVAMAEHTKSADRAVMAAVLSNFARRLYKQMFAPGAPNSTTHILTRDYARRILQLAAFNKRGLFSPKETGRFTPPFAEGGLRDWKELKTPREEIHGGDSPFRMDFENYTLGRLTPSRANYDSKHPEYRKVRAQILWRIGQLGWTAERFKTVDERIADRRRHYRPPTEERQTDRYGKKYSWIAYHEMAGLLHDTGVLAEREHDDHRTSHVDIDPSFPSARPEEKLINDDFLGSPKTTTRVWIQKGATPNIAPYLRQKTVQGHSAPWRLLDGFFTQEDHARGRRIFCFVRSFLAPQAQSAALAAALRKQSMRGRWLPEKPRVIYTYAGEIPWCATFPNNGRTQLKFVLKEYKVRVRRRGMAYFLDGKRIELPAMAMMRFEMFGDTAHRTPEEKQFTEMLARVQRRKAMIEVEETNRETRDFDVLIPVCDFGWEGTTLEIHPPAGPVLAKELATALHLTGIPQSLDLATRDGQRATCGVVHRSQSYNNSQTLFYIREDLLKSYLRQHRLSLVQVTWGERELGGKAADRQLDEPDKSTPGFKVFHTVTKVDPT